MLGDLRRLFTQLICEHVLWVNSIPGHAIALDEGRDAITVKDPTSDHMKDSNHEIGLAQDLLLYINTKYIETTEGHLFSGLVWEKRHPLCRWGGRFKKADGNHYSFEYQGRM